MNQQVIQCKRFTDDIAMVAESKKDRVEHYLNKLLIIF